MKCGIFVDDKMHKFVDMRVEIGDKCRLCGKSLFFNFNSCGESSVGHTFQRYYDTVDEFEADYQRDRAIRADIEQMQREEDEYWGKVQSGEIKRDL